MIRLDFDLACHMACTGLPEGWVIEIHLEKGVSLLGLFPPIGARQDFEIVGTTMTDQMLKALAVAKATKIPYPETNSMSPKGRSHSKRKV
jgi:hypothetical protein